jgi:hypothetical protein
MPAHAPRAPAPLAAALLVSALLAPAPLAAAGSGTTADPLLPARLAPLGPALALAGCGAETLLWAELYRLGLYLPPGAPRDSGPASALASADLPKAVRLVVSYAGELPPVPPASWRARLDRLEPRHARALAEAWPRLRRGDAVTVAYRPGRGTVVALGDRVVTADPGHGLMAALAGFWLGEDPVSEPLRAEVLAGPCGAGDGIADASD